MYAFHFIEQNWEFRIFHILFIMAKKRKLTEQVSQSLHESENKYKEENSSFLGSNDDEVDHREAKSQIVDLQVMIS